MNTQILRSAILTAVLLITGCSSTSIAVREKLGTPKREQLVDRVDETRDAQVAAKEQFATTLDELKSLSGFQSSELEAAYRRVKMQHDRSNDRAERVSGKIKSVDRVARALFKEWEAELKEYSTDSLRRASEQQLDDTRDRYEEVIVAMRRAESKMGPVQAAFNDQVLFLKHNLNARAIASLGGTLVELEGEISALIADMEASIDAATRLSIRWGLEEGNGQLAIGNGEE